MLKPCGTRAAYLRHRQRGEDCPTCRAAAARKRREDRRRQGIPPLLPPRCGTISGRTAHYNRGEPICDDCREAFRVWQKQRRRKRSEGPVSIPSVIFDVLETAGTSMGWRSLSAWVTELHPEWAEATVKRTLARLVAEGRVERVEFGDEIRYRI